MSVDQELLEEPALNIGTGAGTIPGAKTRNARPDRPGVVRQIEAGCLKSQDAADLSLLAEKTVHFISDDLVTFARSLFETGAINDSDGAAPGADQACFLQ